MLPSHEWSVWCWLHPSLWWHRRRHSAHGSEELQPTDWETDDPETWNLTHDGRWSEQTDTHRQTDRYTDIQRLTGRETTLRHGTWRTTVGGLNRHTDRQIHNDRQYTYTETDTQSSHTAMDIDTDMITYYHNIPHNILNLAIMRTSTTSTQPHNDATHITTDAAKFNVQEHYIQHFKKKYKNSQTIFTFNWKESGHHAVIREYKLHLI